MLGFRFGQGKSKRGSRGGPSMFAWAVWRSRSPSIVRARALITDSTVLRVSRNPTSHRYQSISFDDHAHRPRGEKIRAGEDHTHGRNDKRKRQTLMPRSERPKRCFVRRESGRPGRPDESSTKVTKSVPRRAACRAHERLGYEAHDLRGIARATHGTARKRRSSTLRGPDHVNVPRDREDSFESIIVPALPRLDGSDQAVISQYAKGNRRDPVLPTEIRGARSRRTPSG